MIGRRQGRYYPVLALTGLVSLACGSTAYGNLSRATSSGLPCWEVEGSIVLGCPSGEVCMELEIVPPPYCPNCLSGPVYACTSTSSGCDPENPCGCGPYLTTPPPDGGAADPSACYSCEAFPPSFDGGSGTVFCVRDLMDGG